MFAVLCVCLWHISIFFGFSGAQRLAVNSWYRDVMCPSPAFPESSGVSLEESHLESSVPVTGQSPTIQIGKHSAKNDVYDSHKGEAPVKRPTNHAG